MSKMISKLFLLTLLLSACGQPQNSMGQSLDVIKEELSVEQFELSIELSKDLHEEQQGFELDELVKTTYLHQLMMAAIIHEAEQRGIEATKEEALERMHEFEEGLPTELKDFYDQQDQKAAEHLGISLGQYREELVVHNTKQTILRDKLQQEMFPHDSREEFVMLIPEWEEFVYEAVLSYCECQ